MTLVIKKNGDEERVTPGEARALVSNGEAEYPIFRNGEYVTREMTAAKPKKRGRPKKKVEPEVSETEETETDSDEVPGSEDT